MKSKLMIFLMLISVAGFSQIRHDQLRKPVVESTDTVLMFKNTSMGFEYTRTVLDTTIIKGLDLFVKERVSDSTSYLLGRLNDTVTYILGQIPTTLVGLDSSGFRITESQISDLKNYLTTEVDPVYSAWDKSSGISITESQISDLKDYLLSEVDPVYSLDSAKIVWFKDLKFTQDSLKTAADSIQAHNLRLLGKQSISDTLTYDATKYDLEQLKLVDLDSTGFSVDTTQVRDLLEFVQNNGGSGSGDGYWEETNGGDTIQNNNLAPVKIQTSLLFGDEESVTGSTGLFVYAGINGTITQPIFKSSDSGSTYVPLDKEQISARFLTTNSTGQYIAFTDDMGNWYLSSDYGVTWSTKSIGSGYRLNMSASGQKMIKSYLSVGTYLLSTNYGQTFSGITVNGTTGYFTNAHVSSDGGEYYLNGSESSRYVYYSTDGVNFTPFGGQLTSGGVPSFLSQDGTVFLVRDYDRIKKSINRGAWVDITPSGYADLPTEMDLSDNGSVIAITNYTLAGGYITRNGGTNWIPITSGSVKFRSVSLTSDGNIAYFGGADGKVYKYEWNEVSYALISSTPIGTGDVYLVTNKGTSSISVHPFEVRENSNYLEASVNNQTAFKINQDGQFGLRTGGFASKINTTVTGDFSALITDKAVKDYIDGSGSTMVYPAAGIPVSLGTSWRSTSIPPAVGYLYYNGANYTWNSGSSDGNNYPTTLVYTAADRQLTLGRNGLSSISTFFPLASATDAGMIKVGSGLSIDGNGVLSSSGGSGVGDSYNGQILYNNLGTVSGFGSYNPTSSVLDLRQSATVLHTAQLSASFDKSYNTVRENITFGSNFKSLTGGGSGYMNGELGSAITTSTAFSLDVSINYNWVYMNSTLTDALTTGTIQFTAYNITDDTFVFKTYNVVIKRTGTIVSYLSKVETSTVGSDTAALSESISVSYANTSYTTILGVTRNTTKQHNIRIVFIGSVIPLIRPN